MNKFTLISIWTVLVSVVTFLIVIIYWLVYPYKVVNFNNLPFPITNENKQVHRGEHLLYEMDYCKYVDIVPRVRKFLTNGFVFEIKDTVGIATKGCRKIISEAYISKSTPLGRYYLRTTAEYKVNPIRTVVINNYTEEFDVID